MLTLEQMAREVGTSLTRLSGIETGRIYDGAVLSEYEQVLGLPDASLRGPVGVLCRTFPTEAPVDKGAYRELTPQEVGRLGDRLLLAPRTSNDLVGGDWLAWARVMARPGAAVLPESTAWSLLDRLASELGRAVGPGFASRYEALSLLRCSDYSQLVGQVIRERVTSPGVQLLFDQLSALSELPTPESVAWMVRQLSGDRQRLALGAAIGLSNVSSVAQNPGVLREHLPAVVGLYQEVGPRSARGEAIAGLLHGIPERTWRATGVSPPNKNVSSCLTTDEQRVALRRCQQAAVRFAQAWGLPEQPLYARLLFDAVFVDEETVSCTSLHLLGAIPSTREHAASALALIISALPRPDLRARYAWRLAGARFGVFPASAHSWLTDPDQQMRSAAVLMAAAAGADHSQALGNTHPVGNDFNPALFSQAMTGVTQPGPVREAAASRPAAAWWAHEGTAVLDKDSSAS